MKPISTTKAPAAVGPYSQAIESEGTLFCSGQIPLDPDTKELILTDITAQTHRVMKNIGAVLEAAGYTYDHVVKNMIFLTDLNDFDAVNEVYASYFKKTLPARSCVQVSALPKGVNVEIEALARK